jgi:hypothetical protein
MSRKPRLRSGTGITMHDVGQAAGVSAITVSRALHSPERVSPPCARKSCRWWNSWAMCPTALRASWPRPARTPYWC